MVHYDHFDYVHGTKDVEDETRSPKHTLLQQPKRSIHRPCLAQQTDHESKSVRDAVVEGQTRKDNRKVIIRSSYFKHKLIDENNQENEPMISTKDNEDAVPKSALGNGNSNGQFMKRKRPSSDSDQAVSPLFSCLSFGMIFLSNICTHEIMVSPNPSGECEVQTNVCRN